MGAFLAKPNVDKHSEMGQNNGVRYAVTAMQGWRINMEDAHTAMTSLHDIDPQFSEWSFFAIFDGHAGGEVAKMGSCDLFPTIAADPTFSKAARNLAKQEDMNTTSSTCESKPSSSTSHSQDCPTTPTIPTSSSPTTDSTQLQKIQDEGTGEKDVVCEEKEEEEDAEDAASEQTLVDRMCRGMKTGFITLDANIRCSNDVVTGRNRSGSTVTSILLTRNKFFFGNCGDSRALLSRNGEVHFETKDHKPTNDEECKRIIEAGGQVVTQRVNGSLAVSRAIGDYDYKKSEHLDACKQLVSPEPDVTHVVRQLPNEKTQGDEFLVLACDGIYDVMSSKDVCDFIRHRMQLTENLESICVDLIDTCLYLDSKDNMSVIIVSLPGAPKVCQAKIDEEEKLKSEIETCIKEYLATNPQSTWESLPMVKRVIDNNKHLTFPPGGIHSKHNYIETILNRLTNKPEHKD